MSPASGRPTFFRMRPARQWSVPFVAALAAATLWVAPSWVADLGPIPDALEYAVTAQRLAAFEPFGLRLLGHEYPSRYPFGFPALLAPAYWLPNATLASGILIVVAAGVAAVAMTSALARRAGGPIAGIAATLTLLLRPSFLDWNHQIMTETASAALTVGAALLLHRAAGGERGRRRDLLLLGTVIAVAMLVRYTNGVLVLAAVIGLAAAGGGGAPGGRIKGRAGDLLMLFAGPVLALGALVIYHRATFGSFTSTGYQLWVPQWHGDSGSTFSPDYAFVAPGDPSDSPLGGRPNAIFYGAYLLFRVTSPLLVLPALVGAVALHRKGARAGRAVLGYVVACAVLLPSVYALYWFQSGRFLAPLFPLAAVLTGLGLEAGLRAARQRRPAGLAVVGLWCAGALATVPQVAERSYLIQRYVRGRMDPPAFAWRAHSRAAYAAVTPPGSTMVTALPLPLLDTAAVRGRAVIPLVRGRYWQQAPLASVPTLAERPDALDRAIARGEAAYTDAYSLFLVRHNAEFATERRALEAYRLDPVPASASGDRVLLYHLYRAP